MHRSRTPRVLLTGAVIGALLIVASGEVPANASADSVPQTPSVSVSGSTATISWTAPATSGSPARLYYEIIATDTTDSVFFGEAWAAAAATSYDWPALLATHDYSFAIRAVNASGEKSPAATVVASVPAADCSGAAVECVSVDATDVGAANRFVASGLLHGIYSSTIPDYATDVAPLNVQQWRLDGNQTATGSKPVWPYIQANSIDVSTMDILSDAYNQFGGTRTDCVGATVHRTPWENWGIFDTWLEDFVNDEITAGREPDYWDVWNEVNPVFPFYSTLHKGLADLLCSNQVTDDKLLAYLLHSWTGLEALDQKTVVGSWAGWNYETAYGIFDPYEVAAGFDPMVNLNQILTYSDAHSLAWDGFSYHELNNNSVSGQYKDYRGTPRALITNASQARALIANHPLQSGAGLYITEYLGTGNLARGGYNPPGRVAGLFFGLTVADPEQANMTCFTPPPGGNWLNNDCSNGSLDGLLYLDGTNPPVKRAAWYVYEAYGQMTGDLVETASTDATLTGLSAYDSANDIVRVLLGRHDNASVRGDADTTLRVTPPAAFGSDVTFSLEWIEDTGLTVSSPPLHTAVLCDASVNGSGYAELPLDDFPDNDAYLVTVTPQAPSSSNPTC